MGDNKHISQKVKSLYDVLKSNGEDVGSEQEFNDWFLKPGQEGYKNRKYLWDTFNQHGADVGANYEEFAGWLGLRPASQASTSPKTGQQTLVASGAKPLGGGVQSLIESGGEDPASAVSVDTRANYGNPAAVNAWLSSVRGQAAHGTRSFNERSANLLEHAKKNPLGRNTVKSGFKYNKKTGDFEQTYLTPYGTRHTDKAEADEVSRQWREENDHSIEKQIGEAYREQERLEREIEARGKEIEQDMPKPTGLAAFLAGGLDDIKGQKTLSAYDYMRADETYNQLVAASNANKERIKTLEAARDKGGFWRGAINTTTDPNTWLFGVPGLVDAATLYTTSKKLEKNGGDASKLTEAERSMLDNVIANSNAQGEYGDDLGFMYRAGAVTASALPFAVEFAVTDGFSGLANAGARMGEKLAAKAAAKGITGKASQWLIKNTGVAAGDIASSIAMAQTTGAARTASDILGRHMGDATIDEQGNYTFKGGEDLATAAAKGVVSSTLEYYTEKLGGHLQLGKWLSKGAEKVGLSKLSKAINYASSNKWLEKGGVQDYPSEVLEEEANIVLNALLVGDNKFSDLWDAKTQADIWGGMAFSLGFMNAPKYANTGYQAAQYYRYKHKTDKSDAAASRQIGTEQWQELKEMIDGADNEHISDILNSEIIGNDNLNSESRKAAMDYAKNLLEMRGYNMGLLNSVRDDISDKEEDGNKVVDTTVGSSYSEGYNAADETEAATFEMEYGAARENAEQAFDEETLALLDDNPVYTLSALRSSEEFTDEALAIAVDYVNAKAARDGAEQRMADDLDSEIDAARGEVTQRINGDDFMIHGAQMKADNADGTPKRVHIISGNVSMREDGSVDAAKSNQTIVVRDAATGKVEMVSPEHIRSVDEAIDPQEEYAQAEAEARASYEQKKARVLEGRTEEPDVPGETDVPGENPQTETPQAEIKGKEEQAKNQQIEEEQGNPPQIKPQAEGENLQTEMQAEAESPIVEQAEIPVEKDKKGNVVRTLYHRVPMQRTLEDLYDGSLDQEEIDRFVENLAADAKRRLASVENENKPKIGNNKQAYLEAKKRHEDKLSDARAEVEYYDKLQKEVLRVTQRGGQQTGVAEDLGGEPLSLEELAARFASEYKVTPESLKGETGMSGNELKGFVGLVAKEENGGVSIERLGELLARSDEWAQLGGTPEMTQEARNMLIDAYMSGNPRSYVKQQRERFAQREAEHEMSEIENFAQAAFGMSAEEYLAYEEQALPAIINKYAGFDFDIYYAILQEQADARESEAEANNNNSINGNTNEQQGESNGNGGRGGILQTEGTADEQGERTSDEQETGGQGSVGNAGLQGVGTQGNVGEGERANTDDRRGGNGSLAGREQGGLAQEEVNYQLSDEVDENGRQSAGIFKTSYGANRDVVYDRHTTDNQPAETNGASLSGEQSGTTPSTSMNAPAQSYKNGALDNTTDTGKTHNGNGNDTATPESTVVSAGKVTEKENSVQTSIANAEQETDTDPSEAQKKAGNYKKGHLKIDGFDVTIENPKGSVRSGVDADGEKWEQTMNNTYGYIRGTEGVDGDHIDVFLSDDPSQGDVFVVDQVNKGGAFDEHKVMYGFASEEEARNAYLSNYKDGWTGLGAITRVSKEEFKKWVDSSHRKTKPFAEYKGVKKTESTGEAEASNSTRSAFDNLKKQASDRMLIFKEGGNYEILYEDAKKAAEILGLTVQKKDGKTFVSFPIKDLDKNLPLLIRGGIMVAITDELVNTKNQKAAETEAPGVTDSRQVGDQDAAPYTITPAQYTTKKGKALDMHLVKFSGTLTKEQQRAAKELAKAEKGWYDREQGGFMMRSEESAKQLADTILNNEDAVSDAQPVSLADTRKIVETEQQVQPTKPSGNRLVTDERYAELRDRMRKKLGGQMNIGIDPEILAIGTEMAVYHLEKGARKFTEYAKAMIADLGDAIRPYLKSFYNGARNLPEVEGGEIAADMTPYDEVQQFNVATFDKEHSNLFTTIGIVAAEQAHQKEAEQAKQEIINQRNTERRNEDEQTSASTEAIASQAEVVAGEAERIIEEATTEEEVTEAEQKVDEQLNAIDEQLAKFNIDDLHSGMRVILKDGRIVLLSMVMHSGEQLSATQFSKPRVHRLYGIHKGQMVDISPADVDVDATRRLLEGDEVATPVEEETKQVKAKKSKKKAVNLQQSGELGLFDGLFDNETNNEDGLQRNDAIRSEGVPANGNRHEQGLSRGYETGSESERQGSRGTDNKRETTGDEVDRAVRPRLSDTVTEPKNTRNNHSERGKDHAPTSVDARIEANIKAIELAKQLLESGEQATEKQMQTLRKFSGWGGLGKAFSEGTYYAPNNIAKRLRELLGEAAYQEAVMSANSAYYTPAYVVDTLWDIAEQMGFKGGNILEGSAGIGNILGQMPTYISERSDIHAIEIDGTSGGILSLLYPDAKVEVQGFEETRITNGSVDLAITNVPFVTGLRVNDTTGDKDLSKKFHNIHDFCIAKNVRKLREGGLGIFITSNGTLDNSKKLRDWIVNEGGSDFVGAFRMHNKTFGGTGVTSDIIVIRKRVNGKKSANAIDVSAISGERTAEYDTGETRKVKGQTVPVVKQLSMDYNQYFIEHPENMAGEMHFAFEKGDMFRPTSKGLYPKQDKKQEQMLAEFVQSFAAEEFGERTTDEIEVIDAMPGKKIGEVFVNDGKLYINAIGAAQPLEVNANKVKGHTKVECFEAYSAIKEALAAVLGYQITNDDNNGLKPLLAKLNKAYDDFVATYGHFNKNTAIAFLRNDVDYANVASVENYEEIGDGKGGIKQTFSKADVMKGRVVEKEKEPAPSNVKDGIVASIFKYGRIDIPYISEQLGKSEAEVKAEIIESGFGFEDPATRQVEVSYQYLSGNVREKLRQAQENNENGEFGRNIKALQEVIPMTIPAHLIDFTLGSSWIEPKLYEDYVKERTDVGVQFTAVGGTWFMHEPYLTNYEKNRAMGVTSEMLGRTVMGHTLIEAAIQNKSITVSTTKKNWDGSTDTITDKEATQACAVKIDEIRQDFKEWARQKMQSDAEMSERMERIYNDTFNNYVPMRIPDDFVPEYFGGASHKFKMRPHQGRAIVRGTMQPLLLAHEVGTGKTFTLISTAMEMRRLGTARKPMIVVQNATVGQFVASAKELYPNAKILTLEEADRSAEGRKNFYAKIRYNDWDMIVVPQSTFEFIPDSEERQMSFVQEKIEEKMLVLEKMKEADPDGKSMITRQAEREIALLEEELAGLSGETGKKRTANDEKKRAVALQNAEVRAMEMLDRRTDDVENFDDMGIDALLIDEAHEYKHLGFATAMQRGVKGVDPSYSKKSQGVFLKTQAVLEKNNGRNVIFATGTPISNTAAEIWTFMRYLMPADTMKEYGIYYFDDFVRNFGNIQQMLEFTTSGKFKENNRFAGYVNLPELVRIWSGVSDTVLTKEADDVSDKIPDMEGGKAQDLYLPQTRALRSIMKFVKAQLEEYDKMSGKEKKENSHIPLTMYGIAKAAAVDARLVQSDAEDDANSKTNEAVRQTLRSLQETAEYKGTVAIFADNYQNKESGFNLYEDIRAKLIAEGVPANEIVVMKSGMTVKKKLEIFEKVNRGEVRVILGSTFTLGTGVNIQERLHTLIHLDAPNRPMDYTQRNGRILRQGNLHKAMGKPIRILRFGVEDSLDVTAYQRLKTKGAIADSIMNGKQMMANSMTNRVLEEEEDVFGDTVAQLSGSEYAMLKNNAEKNIRKYASRKKQWEADQTYIHNAKPKVKALINDAEKRVKDNSRYLEAVRTSFPDGKLKEIVIGKHRFTTIDAMEDFFKEHNKSLLAEMKQMKDGGGVGEQKRQLTIQIGDFLFVVTTKLTRRTAREGATLFNDVERKMTYSCAELGIEDTPVRQNLLRNAIDDITNNVITGRDFSERLEAAERSKKHNEAELEQLLSREGKPFEYEEELEQAKTQYDEYAELMKKELEQKEAKYAEMDADVETAGNISNTDEDDEVFRDGRGAYTDDNVSMENDPWSKMAGYNIRSKKERMAFAERERRRMVAAVTELAERLGIADDVEIVTDLSGLQGRQRRAKGIYRKSNGKITIYIPNHINVADAVATFLHEAVAHKGLRNLFGKHFDEFLDKVYANSNSEIRSAIDALARKKKLSTRTATEEYLAGLAEKTDFVHLPYNGWLQRVKTFFIEMLGKMGIKALDTTTLTDNELRFILWRSYRYMEGKDKGIIAFVEDTAMKMKLGVGYSEKGVATNIDKNKALRFIEELQPLAGTTIKSEELVSAAKIVENFENPKIEGENSEEVDAEADELFREAAEVDKAKAATIYNNRIKSGMYQTYEAMLDSMAGLKEAIMSVLKAEGSSIKYIEDVPDSENAYLGENRLSSVNEAECEAFQRTLFDPLLREVANIAKTDKERRELTDYMMMKHGLERNAYMRKEATKKKEETDRDFAGLTTLLGIEDVYEAEAEAQRLVEEYEAGHNTDILWKCVKDVTQATLRKSYECGIISKDTFYKTILMYDYYIPLRGFSDKTSSEEYTYLNHSESSFNAPIRTARGRSSKADDPILQMQLMAESAILQGNRNRFVKQRFLNFAERHPSDLISVRSVWLKYDDALEEWRPVFADINEYDTPEEALRKQEEFDERMEALAESDKEHFKKQSEHPEIPYRVVEKRDLREHQVLVKRGGIDYVLTINGSPRAAQAVNGKTNPDNVGDNAVDKVLEFCGNINRTLSMLYTTASPDFVVGNFARDCIYANTIVWAKEGAKYASKFNVNYAMLSKPGRMKLLFEKYRKGKLDMSNERERLFLMFIKNGGETGFLRMGDIDQYRDKIKKKLRDINAKIPAGEMIASAATWIGEVGRAVETQARFAAFMTSMQAGRSIGRSIWDAKEISVNFNKKGAGDKFMGGADQTKVGNVSAFTSALGRCLYVFWNAGLQGTFNNFGKTLVRNPKKTTAVMAASFALGLIVSMLGKMAGDDDGDDNGDDEETDTFGYYDISKHTRRQNLVVKIPGTKSWFKLPLPIEFRAMYGMGELAGSTIFGGEPLSAGDMLAQVSQLAPIDAMEGWRALIPSLAKPAADAYVNETWYGTPIYKDTTFNKYMPEWAKAPKNTNKYLVDLAATLNEMTGGDKYSKGKIDINPAIWEYLLRQYGGGIFTVASQLTSLYSVANGSKEADWRYVPLLNRFVMSSGDHKATPGLNERYFEIMDKLKSDDNRISAIKKDYAIGQDEQRKLIGEVVNDEMYRTLKAFDEEYKARKEGLDYYQNIGDVENAKKAAREIKELKMRAVEYANKKEKEE